MAGEQTFIAQFDGAISGWAVNHIKKNYWRVGHLHDFEDLISDAYLKFLECKQRYEGEVTEPKHFMALFKRAFSNHIHDLSVKHTEIREHIFDGYSEDLVFEDILAVCIGDENPGFMMALIDKAPPEVKLFINLLDDDEFLKKLREGRRYRNLINYMGRKTYRVKETNNQLICRLLGLDSKRINIINAVRTYLAV